MLQTMRSQRVRHDCMTELNTESNNMEGKKKIGQHLVSFLLSVLLISEICW